MSSLERCPSFRGVLIEGFHCIQLPTSPEAVHYLTNTSDNNYYRAVVYTCAVDLAYFWDRPIFRNMARLT